MEMAVFRGLKPAATPAPPMRVLTLAHEWDIRPQAGIDRGFGARCEKPGFWTRAMRDPE
jgi:hypothetical protein